MHVCINIIYIHNIYLYASYAPTILIGVILLVFLNDPRICQDDENQERMKEVWPCPACFSQCFRMFWVKYTPQSLTGLFYPLKTLPEN